jgi:hypothetical protein
MIVFLPEPAFLASGKNMWHVESIEHVPRVLDFSSSGQGLREVTTLIADGICIANAVSLLDFANIDERLQVHICENCGVTGCEPGGWITLRRLGSAILWVPCFEAMAADVAAAREYAPPTYERGLPIFGAVTYEALRRHIPEFPPIELVAPLRSRDAIRLLQWHAPGRVLGRFPDPPRLRREAVLASDLGELDRAVDALEATVAGAWENDRPLREVENGNAKCFYLDLPGTPAWAPITEEIGVFSLYSREGPFVSATSSSNKTVCGARSL